MASESGMRKAHTVEMSIRIDGVEVMGPRNRGSADSAAGLREILMDLVAKGLRHSKSEIARTEGQEAK